ncbi:DNase I-like protein [Gigaspora margarita]|uniref:DNase I-like protein n=1 Tax=Gigaspora margarita TaxID=4874 RepID=A0A8H4A1H4_GIGMA|nr:DNase I-like protein [Gigaspora margarita]
MTKKKKDSKVSLISTFNIKEFGIKKFNDNGIMKFIINILKRYNIVLCQEVHLTNEISKQLVDSLLKSSSVRYSYVLSQLTGTGSYKERYLYLYRSNKWKVLENYLIDSTKFCDKFFRVPYVARFQNLRKPHIRIILIGCHIHPDNAYEEIITLVNNVYVDIKAKLEKKDSSSVLIKLLYCLSSCISSNDNEPIIVMSDLNALGSYLNKRKQVELDKILKDNYLMWEIDYLSDITVGTKCNAYDRFVFEVKNKER